MTNAQVISIVPKAEDPEMRVYTVASLDELIELRFQLSDPQIAEYIVDVQVVHWDEDPTNPIED